MPRRALRCIVDLELHAVSAPGVWLPSREDVYVSVSLFSQYRNTRLATSCFPLILGEKFRFEKTYYTAVDPSQVADMLEDEIVIFELVQLSEYTDGAVRLASYSTNCRDFLYPYSTLAPSYSAHEREILMCRTVAFPGISPKLEFSTKTIIRESISPEIDALDDALARKREVASLRKPQRRPSSRTRWAQSKQESPDEEVEPSEDCAYHRRPFHAWTSNEDGDCPPHYSMPTVSSLCRSRSPSPTLRRKLADINLDSTIDPRPPFVVRKLDNMLIGRKPGGENDKLARSRPKTSARSVSPVRRRSFSGGDELNLSYNAKPRNHLSTVIRSTYRDPLPVYKTRFSTVEDDIDREVAALTTKRALSPMPKPRPRSVSPLLYRKTLKERVDDILLERSLSPTYYDRVLARGNQGISVKGVAGKGSQQLLLPWRKINSIHIDERELARLRRMNRIYDDYYTSLDDLDLELRLARIRASRY